jgi:hypothetical protein
VRLAVLPHGGRYGFIQQRQLVILDVDDLELRVFAAFQDVMRPPRHCGGLPAGPRTPDDDSNLQHFAPFLSSTEVLSLSMDV